MKQYEDKKFETWREQVEGNLITYLKRNLLTRTQVTSATTRAARDESGSDHGKKTPVQGTG